MVTVSNFIFHKGVVDPAVVKLKDPVINEALYFRLFERGHDNVLPTRTNGMPSRGSSSHFENFVIEFHAILVTYADSVAESLEIYVAHGFFLEIDPKQAQTFDEKVSIKSVIKRLYIPRCVLFIRLWGIFKNI